ncbi:DUF1611 domain-containing protein [Aphanothece hegewaldii CCALA 016]|uniref:DUF1611 domain-containing protein n=1 Tax=Aphanothece hegewaldii CCALA 016 TaxID=2107694 RepID=A0A2T1M3P3_9CHRO|nr:DUF1611 domain-containing protein [Aphanothece hegewaldii]PSF39438.1 DUF1611 domain-containing protein [Aphanothece hegewaldii CCALA 016]
MLLTSDHRVAILLHEGISGTQGKTGLAYIRYGGSPVVAIIDAQNAGQSSSALTGIAKDIPIVASLQDTLDYNPDVLLIGIAPSGGILPDAWYEEVKLAVTQGISIVNGLHTPLSPHFPILKDGQWIWDIRQEPVGLRVGKARTKSLSCQRILTIGTDMSVGKMSTSIELNRLAQKRGIKSKFLATGQGGIMIAGEGIPLDAIRVDFAAGAVEQMVLESGKDHDILWIEGQGSLLHPGSTATLPLIRGSQPTDLILVHRFGQIHIKDLPNILIPPLTEVIKLYEMVASAGGTFEPAKIKGISLNTFHLDHEDAKTAITKVQDETGLPCTDVVRFGGDVLLDAVLSGSKH